MWKQTIYDLRQPGTIPALVILGCMLGLLYIALRTLVAAVGF